MSRRNRDSSIRGPASALTSFLKFTGRIIRDDDPAPANVANQAAVDGSATTSNAPVIADGAAADDIDSDSSVSDDSDEDDKENDSNEAEPGGPVNGEDATTSKAGVKRKTRAGSATKAAAKRAKVVEVVKTTAAKKKAAAAEKAKAKKTAASNKKGNRKAGKKKESDNDDEDEEEGELFGASSKNGQRRRKGEVDGELRPFGTDGRAIMFCQRCLRKYVPEDDTNLCVACQTIPSKSKKMQAAKIKHMKSRLVGDIEYGSSIMSLRDMCIKVVSDNIDLVEEFGDIPDSIKRRISAILSRQRQINSRTLNLFIGPNEETIELFDCARLSANCLRQIAMSSMNVRVLNLSDCGQMNDEALDAITSNCPHLHSLTLKGPFLVTDKAYERLFTALGGILRLLCLENAAKLSSSSIECLADNCPNVESLSLGQCRALKDEGVKSLEKLARLETLVLEELGEVKDESIVGVIKSIGKALKVLELNGFPDMEDLVLLDGIAPNCRKLQRLSLRGNESLTDEGFVTFLNAFQPEATLSRLNVSRVVNLKDDALNSIVSHHGNSLEFLGMNGLEFVTTHSLQNAFCSGNMPRLEEVDLSWVRSLDDDVFGELVIKCPMLKSVKIYGCNKLTEFSLLRAHINANGAVIRKIGNEFD
ncbi:hypothetical protein HK101_009134 [Irineochytrium annulatum]|nr:hypothetical protein HK101_009134 [Irineochytrium annulatum]